MKRKREAPQPRQFVKRDATLPVLEKSAEVFAALAKHDVLVVIANTGSGKTTQIPQLILDAQSDASVVVTQPRRVAAMTVAARVAAERRCVLGTHVGYTVRFNDKSQRGVTRIRYVTDGVLLREALLDGPHALRARYSHLIVDEVHERSVGTDVVLGLVRQMLAASPPSGDQGVGKGTGILAKLKRSQLQFKVIIMSATTDDKKLLDFFRAARPDLSVGALHLPGQLHPIRTVFSTTQVDDYVNASIETVLQIHGGDEPGDILVFLAGMEDITSALAILADRAHSLDRRRREALVALPLYAALPPAEQLRAIEPLRQTQTPNPTTAAPPASGPAAQKKPRPKDQPLPMRKVVFATNVAETSVTIPGVAFVVDCGVAKVRDLHTDRGFVSDVLRAQAVSKAQANQRSGRAGRTGAGTVYRLYTEDEFKKFTPFPKPELLRVEVTGPVLQVIALAGVAASRRQQRRLLQKQQQQQGDGGAVKTSKLEQDGKDKDADSGDADAVSALEMIQFPLVDRVQRRCLERALETLVHLGALDLKLRLTQLGGVLARIPATPQLARALVESVRLGCGDAMTTIAAMLSVEGGVFVTPAQKLEQARAAHKRFLDGSGDHLTLANVLNEYLSRERDESAQATFCREHFLNARTLASAAAVRAQLVDVLKHADVSGWALRNTLSAEVTAEIAEADRHELVRRALLAGFFRNVGRRRAHDGRYVLLGQEGSRPECGDESGAGGVDVHPSSALRTMRRRRSPEAVVFHEVVLTTKVYMRTVTAVELRWVRQHSAYYRRAAGGGGE